MNRKGYINLTWFFVIVMIIVALAMAQNGWDAKTGNELYDKLNWTSIYQNVSISIDRNIESSDSYYVKVILSIVEKAIDFIGYAIFEVGKMAARVAIDNPNIINYKVLFGLLVLSLIAPIIYPLFTIIVSIILIIKEWYQVRKEKKAYNARVEGQRR